MEVVRVLIAIFALGILVMVHELGHFSFAKLFKVKVKEFWIFVGPKLFGWKGKETEYSVRLLPIGGMVMMEDEEEDEEADVKSDEVDKSNSVAFNSVSAWKRALIIIAGPAFNVIIAMILLVVVTLSQGYVSTEMDIVDESSPAYVAGIRTGDKLKEVDGVGVHTVMDYSLVISTRDAGTTEYVVERNGEEMTFQVEPGQVYQIGVMMNQEDDGTVSLKISELVEGAPAQTAGLVAGDVITKVNGKQVDNFEFFSGIIDSNQDRPLAIEVDRNGEKLTFNVTPALVASQYTGVYFKEGSKNFFDVVGYSAKYCVSTVKSTAYSIKWLFTGRVGVQDMAGPVGIVTTMSDAMDSGDTAGQSFLNLLYMIAFISLSIGIFNLIPFPGLDGSKILIIIGESILRRKMKPSTENIISLVGMGILLVLMVVFTFNDISRLFG